MSVQRGYYGIGLRSVTSGAIGKKLNIYQKWK